MYTRKTIPSNGSPFALLKYKLITGMWGLCVVAVSIVWPITSYSIETEQTLPEVIFDSAGEIVYIDGKATFQAWSSTQPAGQMAVLNIIEASNKAADLNTPFFDRLVEKKIPAGQLLSVNIIVSKKIAGPFRGFVKRSLKKNKKRYPDTVLIEDREGLSWQQWSQGETQSAVMLLDKTQQVIFYREGKLTEEDSAKFFALIEQHLQIDVLAHAHPSKIMESTSPPL